MIIAIDGPAASGKGTLAKRVAEHFGFHCLDTGLLYRAVARDVAASGFKLEDTWAAVAAAKSLDPKTFEDPVLRGTEAGDRASVVAKNPRGPGSPRRLPARLRQAAPRCRAGWPRHRHGHLPGCGR